VMICGTVVRCAFTDSDFKALLFVRRVFMRLADKYSENAVKIYERLYLRKSPGSDSIIETIEECHDRVARTVSETEEEYRLFKYALDNQIFRPNTPTMLNAGVNDDKTWLACFVFGLEDSMDSIIDMWATCARVYEQGGGVGIPFYKLREKGSPISKGGYASGPISYMRVVQAISDQVKSGGTNRRAANLGALRYDHPDIFDFIVCKQREDLSAMNLSVIVDDDFMKKVVDGEFDSVVHLVSPNYNFQSDQTTTVGEIWKALCNNAWATGDPGLLFYNAMNRVNPLPSLGEFVCTNPCSPNFATISTPYGIRYLGDIKEGDIIWSGSRWTKVVKKWYRGIKPVYRFVTTAGVFEGTMDHKIVCRGEKVPVGDADAIDTNVVEHRIDQLTDFDPQAVADGLVIGDGTYHKASNGIFLCIGQNDQDYFDSEIKDLILGEAWGYKYRVKTTIDWLPKTYERIVPERYFTADFRTVCSFLRGLFSANGSVIRDRVTLKQSSRKLIEQVQQMLSFVGIRSYITTNRGKKIKFRKGTYECKTSYNLNIFSDKDKFYRLIGFIQQYKMEKLRKLIENQHYKGNPKITYEIVETQYLGDFPVYDIMVEAPEHTYWSGGLLVSNCGEVVGRPWECCCLGHINLNKCLDEHNKFNDDLLKKYVTIGVTFLNRVINKTPYPHPEFRSMMLSAKPIGLGLMGFADILYKMKIPYNSDKAIELFSNICKKMTKYAFEASIEFSKKTGIKVNVPDSDRDAFEEFLNYYLDDEPELVQRALNEGIANTMVTSIAPTGSTSLSADASFSFEPHFALVWEKRLSDTNEKLMFVNSVFKEECNRRGITLTDAIIEKIAENKGSIRGLDSIFPSDLQEIFVTAHDIDYMDRIWMQAAGQRWVTQAISSTVNLPNAATVDDVDKIFKLAWQEGLKGITIYRDGCKEDQPVVFGKDKNSSASLSCSIQKIERPTVREGKTVEFVTPRGRLYVTGNFHDGNLIEVFLNMGRQGSWENVLLNTVGRLTSKLFQYRIPTDEILDTLKGSGGDPFWFNLGDRSYQANGVVDAIAQVLEMIFCNKSYDSENNRMDICPRCNRRTLVRISGCRGGICSNPDCGYTACN